ncbi:MAG TPA: fatty acid desaturase [Vicinamibacterales bacterium]|nr:fatty acid desaturase [Vicinamibacterales bacterium]
MRSAGGLLLLAAAFGLVMNSVYAVIHEAEHRMLFERRTLNDAAGILMALFFPAPFHLLRQGHLGHHLRNRSDDEAFDLYFDGEHPVWKRLQLYGILTGFYWLVAVLANIVVLAFPFVLRRDHFEFDRPSAAFMDALNPGYNRIIRIEAVAVLAVHAAILWWLSIPLLNYTVMYAGFGISWSAMQYVHHFGTTRHVLEGARNLWIWAPIDLIWLNHNWHLTHHKHPTVPWIHLPALGRSQDPERGFLPLHYLRMWRGPRKAAERVRNRYAGRVIR